MPRLYRRAGKSRRRLPARSTRRRRPKASAGRYLRRKRVYGRGSYRFGSSSGGYGGGIAQKIPTFGAGGEGVIYISQREQLGVLKCPASDGFQKMKITTETNAKGEDVDQDAVFRINAGNAKLFPWGSGIAQKFEMYKVIGCIVQFESLINNNALTAEAFMPELLISSHDNPNLSGPTSAQQMKIQPLSAAARVDRNLVAGVECHPARIANNGWQFVVPMNTKESIDPNAEKLLPNDRNETDLGNIFIYIDAMNEQYRNKKIGKLWVSYKLALMRPVFQSQFKYNLTEKSQALDPTVEAGHRQAPGARSEVTRVSVREAQQLDFNEETSIHTEPHMPNNVGHTQYKDSELIKFQDFSNANWYEQTTWSLAEYPGHPYYWGNTHSATNGQPLGFTRFTHIEVKNFNRQETPQIGHTYFGLGCVMPFATNATYVQDTNSSTLLTSHVIDNQGWKPVINTSNGRTRFFLLQRPRPGAVYIVTFTWTGLVQVEDGNKNYPPQAADDSAQSLLVVARTPKVEISDSRYMTIFPHNPVNFARGDYQYCNLPPSDIVIKAKRAEQFPDYCSAANANTILNIGGAMNITGTAIHHDWPTFQQGHTYTQEFALVCGEQVSTSELLPYFEMTPLTSSRNVLLAGGSLTHPAGGSNFDNAWAVNTSTAPKSGTGDITAVRYGSRSISIRETTYHEMADFFSTKNMFDRDTKYSLQQAEQNAASLKQTSGMINSNTMTSVFAGNQ